jgi:2-polyprenyl-3-methyl-5-hydroxy-6-metoxy-1,4-benzoquinol methylase
MIPRKCWCGSDHLEGFSREYSYCRDCGTLVSQAGLSIEQTRVRHDEKDFYGKNYWLSHQKKDLGFPDIYERTRSDLPERCIHWMRTILKYKLPPARTLELGCGHGGFVALLRAAGYEASGLELSPWVAEYASKTFGIPMLVGMVEEQDVEPGSLDVIIMMDVLEHLPQPTKTVERCLDLLSPSGILIIQTPCFPEGQDHDWMLREKSDFLQQLKTTEHLYLFSERSVRQLLSRQGIVHLALEEAIFAQYDMFLVAGRTPLVVSTEEQKEAALTASWQGRITLALLDSDQHARQLRQRLLESEADRAARLDVINRLSKLLEESEAGRAAGLRVIEALRSKQRK